MHKLYIQRARERGISNLRANRKRINLSIRGTFLLNRQPVTYLVKFNRRRLIASLKVCKRCSNIINPSSSFSFESRGSTIVAGETF